MVAPSSAPSTAGSPPRLLSAAADLGSGAPPCDAAQAPTVGTVAVGVPNASGAVGWSAVASDLWELTKPRIVTMILITTAIAAVIGSGQTIAPGKLIELMLGVGLVAGSAGAMNQVWERRLDARMDRTRLRPLPAGRLGWRSGAAFAAGLGLLGAGYLWARVGPLPMLLAVATWLVYVPLYTPLKTRSQWNTTVGAISGALPMLIGFTGGGGSLADPIGWLLVGVLVAWQYPHFMAIAWLVRSQYAHAGFRMATTDDPSGRSAGLQSVAGMVALLGCLIALAFLLVPGAAPVAVGLAVVMVAVTYPMSLAAWRFAMRRDDLTARRLLKASLLQLPASLSLLIFAAWYWGS